LNERITDS